MSMKWVSYSYHNLQYIAIEKPRESANVSETKQISGWGCIHMTNSHSRGC